MKAAFSQASLALTVNTLPSVERRQLCYLPPRRSDAEGDLYTDIFSQSQGEKVSARPDVKIKCIIKYKRNSVAAYKLTETLV